MKNVFGLSAIDGAGPLVIVQLYEACDALTIWHFWALWGCLLLPPKTLSKNPNQKVKYKPWTC